MIKVKMRLKYKIKMIIVINKNKIIIVINENKIIIVINKTR